MQRVDIEKTRHKITVTSDVQKEVMAINRKAREEWEKKQAENEKSQKLKKVNTNSFHFSFMLFLQIARELYMHLDFGHLQLNSKESKYIDADKKDDKHEKSTKVLILKIQ